MLKKYNLKKYEYSEYRDELMFILAMIPLLLVPVYLYGFRPIMLAIVSISTAYITDFIVVKMRKRTFVYNGLSQISIGLLLTLLMPATVPYWVVAVGSFFAIAIVKGVFGGDNNNMFNPVGTAFCFLALNWPEHVFSYTKFITYLDVFTNGFENLTNAPSSALQGAGVPYLSESQLFLGNYPGILGGTSILIVLACGIFLLAKKVISWHIPVTFLSTCTIFVFLFPRIITNSLDSVTYEMFATPMLFMAFFVVSDKNTTPSKDKSKIIFGFFLAIITMIYSYNSKMENTPLFALIIMTTLSPYIDRVIVPFLEKINYKEIGEKISSTFLSSDSEKKIEGTTPEDKGGKLDKVEDKVKVEDKTKNQQDDKVSNKNTDSPKKELEKDKQNNSSNKQNGSNKNNSNNKQNGSNKGNSNNKQNGSNKNNSNNKQNGSNKNNNSNKNNKK